jgi:hypothetical protein
MASGKDIIKRFDIVQKRQVLQNDKDAKSSGQHRPAYKQQQNHGTLDPPRPMSPYFFFLLPLTPGSFFFPLKLSMENTL